MIAFDSNFDVTCNNTIHGGGGAFVAVLEAVVDRGDHKYIFSYVGNLKVLNH